MLTKILTMLAENPVTNDNTHIFLWVIVGGAALVLIAICAVAARKGSKDEENTDSSEQDADETDETEE